MKSLSLIGALACASLFTCAHAQVATAGAQAPEASPSASTAAVVAPAIVTPCCALPAGTPIELEIAEAVDSATRKRGDKFAIVLHMAVYAGQTLLLPAGTTGIGEIVHAERARGGGKPGELILAARYLELGGRRIPLRGMKLSSVGTDKSQKALALSMAVGMFAQFVHGGEVQIPQGALATAKLAEAFGADAPASTEPMATQATNPSTTAVSKE